MATQPTNLPVPSESPFDFKFNAGKIDEFVTSMGWTYTDRFGQKHYTIEGINYLAQQAMNAFGYVILTGKTFTTGATINNPNEVLLNTADGEYYKWTGSFASGPKVVPANSTPASTGGIAPGAWLGVGDASLRAALAATSGAGLVGLSVGSVYPAGTVGSAIQYRTPQMYGIEPSATNIIGSGLDAMFAAGGDIRFEKPGTYITDRTWVLRSGTRLWIGPDVTIKLAKGSNVPVFKNNAYANNVGADAYIEICGPGTIDYDFVNQTASGLNAMATIIKGVTELRIGGGIKVINAAKYAWLIADIYNFTASGLNFNTNSDGLHLQTPIRHAFIRNLKGTTGDDMLSFTIGDYDYYDISEPGDFSNIDVDGIYCENALCAVKLAGKDIGSFVRFKISGVYGQTLHSVVRVWNDTYLPAIKVGTLELESIYCLPGDSYTTIDVAARNIYSTNILDIDTLYVNGVFSRNTKAQTISITSTDSNAPLRIRNLTINNPPRDALCVLGVNSAYVTIEDVLISNAKIVYASNVNAAFILNRGNISNIALSNTTHLFPDNVTGSLLRAISGSISYLCINNTVIKNGTASILFTAALGIPCKITMSNVMFDAVQRISQSNNSPMEISFKNCSAVNIGTSAMIFSRGASGRITISGDIINNVNNVSSDTGGSVAMLPAMNAIAADVSLITSVDGASCINTNASLSCGLGRVIVYNKVWKHMFSGATYTSTI